MSAKVKKIKPQLSLFDNENCTQCNTPIKKGFVYCDSCASKWVEKYISLNNIKDK